MICHKGTEVVEKSNCERVAKWAWGGMRRRHMFRHEDSVLALDRRRKLTRWVTTFVVVHLLVWLHVVYVCIVEQPESIRPMFETSLSMLGALSLLIGGGFLAADQIWRGASLKYLTSAVLLSLIPLMVWLDTDWYIQHVLGVKFGL